MKLPRHAAILELVRNQARRLQSALDVEAVTKRFYSRYADQHASLLSQIEGIDDERDRRWYASVILNRLMFVWFLQKKLFLDGGDANYLPRQLAASRQRGPDRFFGEFLNALFFEAFAKPEAERSATARALTGRIPYLNGGLFLHLNTNKRSVMLDPALSADRAKLALQLNGLLASPSFASWSQGVPVDVGAMRLIAIERVFRRHGCRRAAAWCWAGIEPVAIVVDDGSEPRVLALADGVPTLEALRASLPLLDRALRGR